MEVPLTYEIDRSVRRVRVIYHFQPTIEEWVETMAEILRSPQYEGGFGFLLDRSRIPRAASREYIHRMVDFIEGHAGQTNGAKWAILVVDISSFGMARLAETLALSGNVKAFLLQEEAKAWLDRPREV